jgi:two-component system, NtrC family, sensor kinase
MKGILKMKDEARKKSDLVKELNELRRRIREYEQYEKQSKKTEEMLKESEQILQSIIGGSPIPAFVIGNDHRLIYWNKALEELSRIPAEEVMGTRQHWRAFYSKERPCMADLMVDEALEKIPHWYAEKYVKSKLLNEAYEAIDFFPELGDQGKWLRFTAAVIRNSLGDLVGAIETLEDITKRKLAEQELIAAHEKLETRVKERTVELAKANEALQAELAERLRTEQALKQTTDHLSFILESLPIVSYTCSVKAPHTITYISNTIKEITGYSPQDFINSPTFWQDCIHPDDRQNVLNTFINDQKRTTNHCVYRFRISDDSYKWFSDYQRLIRHHDGSEYHIVGAWQDISEEKRIRQEAELRLQQMFQTHKLTALGEVVAGVAHEINNPVSFISYNIPLLEEIWKSIESHLTDNIIIYPKWNREGVTNQEIKHNMCEIIHAFKIASSRITKVINGLKEFSRSDETTDKKEIRIRELIQGALIIVGAQVRRTVSRITQNIEQNIPPVKGHFHKLEQVITNLLINAHQAMPDQRKGSITISSRYIDRIKSVLIEIEDNGTGMTRDTIDHVFDPFFTTRRDTGGTGLGLSISYGLIKEHQGTIAVLSRPGKGSRFIIFLPVDDRQPVKLTPSMLCIDNDKLFLKDLKTFFVDVEKWPSSSSYDPETIVSYLEKKPEIDIVISEILLPGGDGSEIIKLIRQRLPLLTLILYSSDHEAIENALSNQCKADQVLRKPFPMEDLKSAINKFGRQRL